jgi:DNA polymerase theta
LQNRISLGVRPEILALTDIPFVKAYRARILYAAAVRTPEAVAALSSTRLTEILMGTSGKTAGDNNKHAYAGQTK